MILELTRTALAWLLIYPAVFGTGLQISRRLLIKDSILNGVYALAFGMGILSYSVVILSIFHLLNPAALWILLMLLAAAAGPTGWRSSLDWLASVFNYLKPQKGDHVANFLGLASLAAFTILLLGTLTPETGGDALCYQLNLPKRFLQQGSLTPLRFDETSFFPLFINNLYLTGLAAGGVFTAKLFHWLCGLLIFAAVQRIVLRETQSRFLAIFSGLIVILTPGIYNQLSTTYLDVALAAYTFLAAVLLFDAFDAKRTPNFFCAGLLLGCCVSTKYLSLMSVLALGLVWIKYLFFTKPRQVKGFLVWSAGIILACGYWLIRNSLATGNPFYPYFGELIVGIAQRPPQNYFDMGAGKSIVSFFAVFWNMFRHTELFGSFSTRIGLFYVLAWPLLIPAFFWMARARNYVLFTLGFLAAWFHLVQLDRWIFPVLPALTIGAALGLIALAKRFELKRSLFFLRSGQFAALLLTAAYLAGGVYHYRHAYALFTGQISIAQYLNNFERTYPIADWTNHNLPAHAKILLDGEVSKFYFDREVAEDVIVDWQTQYHPRGLSALELARFYQGLGFTHVITLDPLDSASTATPPRTLAESKHARMLESIESKNIRDARYRYRIYEILPAEGSAGAGEGGA